MKKTSLKLVSTRFQPKEALPPPEELSKDGQDLWSSVMKEYQIDDSGSLALLAQACHEADKATYFAKIVAKDGPLQKNKYGELKSHPLLKYEAQARQFVVKTLQLLGVVD